MLEHSTEPVVRKALCKVLNLTRRVAKSIVISSHTVHDLDSWWIAKITTYISGRQLIGI